MFFSKVYKRGSPDLNFAPRVKKEKDAGERINMDVKKVNKGEGYKRPELAVKQAIMPCHAMSCHAWGHVLLLDPAGGSLFCLIADDNLSLVWVPYFVNQTACSKSFTCHACPRSPQLSFASGATH